MVSLTYLKLSGVVLLLQLAINLKPLIGIGLMCNGDTSHCGG